MAEQNAPRPQGWEKADWSKQAPPSADPPPVSGFQRFIGGSPGLVAVRLLVVSLVVGALLMWLDIRPYEILNAIERFFYRFWRMGFAAIREMIDYIIVGAIIVVPIWFVLRLFNMKR
jgi:hypothetical protein